MPLARTPNTRVAETPAHWSGPPDSLTLAETGMNPNDWPTTNDPFALLNQLFPVRGLDSDQPQSRKSRLYLLACGRLAWGQLPGVCRVAIGLAERIYGGRVTDRRLRDMVYPSIEALTHCRGEAEEVNVIGRELVGLGLAVTADVWADKDIPAAEWSGFAHLAYLPFYREGTPNYRLIPAELHSPALIREIFGNPFQRVPLLQPAWLTETVMQLARKADSEGDFGVLPILADALQDAGCDRADLLRHLRSGGPHVPGCWALSAVLGEG